MFNESSKKNQCENLTENRGLECYCEIEDKCIPCYKPDIYDKKLLVESVQIQSNSDGRWSKACYEKGFYKPYTFDSIRLGMND